MGAFGHVRTLSFEAFGRQVVRADEWSFARAAKNTLREARKYLFEDLYIDEDEEDESGGHWHPPQAALSLQRLVPPATPHHGEIATAVSPASAGITSMSLQRPRSASSPIVTTLQRNRMEVGG